MPIEPGHSPTVYMLPLDSRQLHPAQHLSLGLCDLMELCEELVSVPFSVGW